MLARDVTTTDASALLFSSAPGRWVVAVTVLGSGIAALDATVVNIALPTIGREFHVGVGALQWVMSGYTLTLAAFLLIGGSLGDRFGRRKVYSIGILWFALASAACGLAPSAAFLIVARVLQGVGAALLTPGSLAILEASFAPCDRARAIGAWSGLGGVAAAAGPLLGGYLIAAASWRWIFFINIPVAAVVVTLGVRHVPESRDSGVTGTIDYPGALAAMMFLVGVTFAFIEAPTLGWSSPAVLAMAVAGAVGLAAFLLREHSAASPMLPLAIFRERQFAAINAVTFLVYASLAGATFLLPVELQVVSGLFAACLRPRAAAADRHHADAVGPFGQARSADRASAADERRSGRRRRWPRPAHPGHLRTELCDLCAAGSRRLRRRARDHRRAAHRNRDELRTRRALGSRIRGQQRHGPVRRPARSCRAAGAGGHHRHGLPAPGRARRRV